MASARFNQALSTCVEERIDDAANGTVDLSEYFQASWTGGEFTNQEWVAKYGDGDTWDSKKKASLSSAKAPSNVNKYDISKKAEKKIIFFQLKCQISKYIYIFDIYEYI